MKDDTANRLPKRPRRADTAETLMLWLGLHGQVLVVYNKETGWFCSFHPPEKSARVILSPDNANARPHAAIWSVAQQLSERLDAA